MRDVRCLDMCRVSGSEQQPIQTIQTNMFHRNNTASRHRLIPQVIFRLRSLRFLIFYFGLCTAEDIEFKIPFHISDSDTEMMKVNISRDGMGWKRKSWCRCCCCSCSCWWQVTEMNHEERYAE